jgi:hypothetical protein
VEEFVEERKNEVDDMIERMMNLPKLETSS